MVEAAAVASALAVGVPIISPKDDVKASSAVAVASGKVLSAAIIVAVVEGNGEWSSGVETPTKLEAHVVK